MWAAYQSTPALAGVVRAGISLHRICMPATLAPRPPHALQTPPIAIFHSSQAPARAGTRIAAAPAGDNAAPALAAPQPQFGLRQISGDGRCMFRALVQGAHFCAKLDAGAPPAFLTPADETPAADDLRNSICDALLAQRDRFEPFIASDEGSSFDAYVETMRRAETFGGEPELAAAADVIARPITVFRLDPAARQLTLSSEYLPAGGAAAADDWPVPLVYHAAGPHSGHYDLLAPMDTSEAEGSGPRDSGLIL